MSPRRHASLWYYCYFPFEFALQTWRAKIRGISKVAREEECVKGRVVVITGANSGLGKCTAQAMAKRGAVVIMGCRDVGKGMEAREEIIRNTGSTTVVVYRLDLSDLASVREFADQILENHQVVDVLINNAAVSVTSCRQQLTKEGWDLSMTTNHLGHFLLTNLLIESISRSSVARVVTISSVACCTTTLDTSDVMMENIKTLGRFCSKPYQNSKFANALFSKELGKRYPSIKAYTVCPGAIKTNIYRNYTERKYLRWFVRYLLFMYEVEVELATDTVLLCSLAREMENVESGAYFRFGRRVGNIEKMLKDEVCKKVWEDSEKFAGLVCYKMT